MFFDRGSQDEARYFLMSAPVDVHMVGFKSTTVELHNAGWQMSVEIIMLANMFDGAEIKVAFKHEQLRQVAMGAMQLDLRHLAGGRNSFARGSFENALFAGGIQIRYLAPQIAIHNVNPRELAYSSYHAGDAMRYAMGSSFDSRPGGINYMGKSLNSPTQWHAVDPRPELRELPFDLEKIAVFKPVQVGEDFEMFIHKKDEKEILDLLLKKQDVRQKEIRQNMRRREYIDGEKAAEPTNVRAQIIIVGEGA